MKPDGGKKVKRTGEGLLIMPKWCTVILLCLARGPHKSAAAMLNDENHGVCVWPETRNVTRKIKVRIQWASRRAVLFENNLSARWSSRKSTNEPAETAPRRKSKTRWDILKWVLKFVVIIDGALKLLQNLRIDECVQTTHGLASARFKTWVLLVHARN